MFDTISIIDSWRNEQSIEKTKNLAKEIKGGGGGKKLLHI